MSIIRKATSSEVGPDLTFVLSDATVDRYGDVVEPDGWELSNFRKNPIALFNHDSNAPIGRWEGVRVSGGKLVGKLVLAAEGTSIRIDEIRRLVEQGILRATSVGFMPQERAENKSTGGYRFTRQELMETSLVSVPANPNAVQLAKSLHVSDDTLSLVFGEHADGVVRRASTPGEHAANSNPIMRKNGMSVPLSKRIEDAQSALVRAQDALSEHIGSEDEASETVEALSAEVEQKQAALTALQKAEKALMARADAPKEKAPASVAKKSDPKDMFIRSAVCRVLGHIERKSPYEVMEGRYGADENIKTMLDVVTKAAAAPATTTTSGWAAELVQTATLDFMETLMPKSVYPSLRDRGGRFTFGRNGIVALPSRNKSTSVAGAFVAQGAPIPVKQGAFASTTLTPKKMAVITTFTREIAEHSTPSIEGVLREAIQEDTAVAIDTVLLDATAASTTRPAGLKNGVSASTETSGGGFAALVGDIKTLVSALITASGGNLRAPVFIMNPVQALSIAYTQNAGGDFPFAAGIAQSMLNGYPVIQSATVEAGDLFLVDAADFFSATGDEPRFDVSDQATLHMEDSSPAAIGTAGTPNVVAAPVRSLFQTDSIALRMILDMNWSLRRPGSVVWLEDATW